MYIDTIKNVKDLNPHSSSEKTALLDSGHKEYHSIPK